MGQISLGSKGSDSVARIEHTHRPGRHCGSSAIRDLLEFHGLNLTEAFCFGLGAGLGITYVELPDTATPFIVHVRSMGFEEKVFETLGVPFQWETYPDKPTATAALDQYLDAGKPALLLTDIFYLPYFNSTTHFPGHAIVAWHYSDKEGAVMVSDTERPELLPVPSESLADARYSLAPPFVHHGNLFVLDKAQLDVRPERVRSAIVDNAKALKNGGRLSGIEALDTWINDLPRWRAHEKWPWLLRFAYQVIEKRGSGGGGFRIMYAEFLDEAQALLPELGEMGLVSHMRECASAWSALAACLEAGSKASSFPLDDITQSIETVRAAERRYVQLALTL